MIDPQANAALIDDYLRHFAAQGDFAEAALLAALDETRDVAAAVRMAAQVASARASSHAEDASGHEHKGKGPGGGQFAKKGGGAGPGSAGEAKLDPGVARSLSGLAAGVIGKLSSAQRGAITDYTTGMSVDINHELNAGRMPADRDSAGLVRHMDAVMAVTPKLAEPVAAYRGLAFPDRHSADEFVKRLSAGGEVEMPAFTSTSIDPVVSRGYLRRRTGGGHGVMLEIRANHGLYIEGHSGVPGSKGEHEFILPRQSRFKVLGHRREVVGGQEVSVLSLEQS